MSNSEASRTASRVTPLPKLPMCILSVIILSEPLSSTILLPFVYFMVIVCLRLINSYHRIIVKMDFSICRFETFISQIMKKKLDLMPAWSVIPCEFLQILTSYRNAKSNSFFLFLCAILLRHLVGFVVRQIGSSADSSDRFDGQHCHNFDVWPE